MAETDLRISAFQLEGRSYRRLPTDGRRPAGKVHVWTGPQQTRCFCGRFERDDPRLEELEPGTSDDHRLCLSCGYYGTVWDDQYLSRGQEVLDELNAEQEPE